jgi:CHASE3 domain sensor protein
MTIRAKLYTAIVVVVAGLAITVGIGAWAMNELGNRFQDVQRAADARALALRLKFDVTDFNGWQTAYGYDNGKSRPIYLAAFKRFEDDLATARRVLQTPRETSLLARIGDATNDFDRLDAVAWAALQAGRTEQVRRIFLGPEIANFQRAATAAQQLAEVEDANASAQERAFEDARGDALRVLVGAGIVAALLVVILLVTATDLARQAERTLERDENDGPSTEI